MKNKDVKFLNILCQVLDVKQRPNHNKDMYKMYTGILLSVSTILYSVHFDFLMRTVAGYPSHKNRPFDAKNEN